MKDVTYIVMNGPSSLQYAGKLRGRTFGCNFAYQHFELDSIFAVDNLAVKQIEQDNPNCRRYTKKRSWTPKGWHTRVIPGIDSGSYALETAILEYPCAPIYVIGADGILRQNNTTNYVYSWRNGKTPLPYTHMRHRETCIGLIKEFATPIYFVSDVADESIPTITHEEFNKLL